MSLSLTTVGDASDPRCWSGTPYHFWKAARRVGFAEEAWRLDLGQLRRARWLWNARQVLAGRGRGGFQYSAPFLDRLEAQVPAPSWSGGVLSFNPHFPRATTVRQHGGALHHYLDAPFAALASGRGLELRLPRGVVAEALALERENFAASEHVVFMARWAAAVAVSECGVPAEKCHLILPGANLDLPEDWSFPRPHGHPGKERAFTLGFVGKDWRRKGLPLLIEVHRRLEGRGWKTRVLAAGEAPAELRRLPGVEFVGFLDKERNPRTFLDFLSACDLGCLFSEREALGISTLEFLRAGVPVAGFAHEGMADTLPPDAGFRFEVGSSSTDIAERFESYLENESIQTSYCENAKRWSGLVTWDRCICEFQELWMTGNISNPVQPWTGLPD